MSNRDNIGKWQIRVTEDIVDTRRDDAHTITLQSDVISSQNYSANSFRIHQTEFSYVILFPL